MAVAEYPTTWKWTGIRVRPLNQWVMAPETNGFYELGFLEDGVFRAMYGGRAAGVTLRQRLRQHSVHSHNLKVRRHAARLSYRCKSLHSAELASFVEALHLAAMDYRWNKRQEWRQHWALED